MDSPSWKNLPDIALIEVYSYLSDADRGNMALTCRNWSDIFKSPRLWRSRYFELGGYKAAHHGQMAIKFTEKYGPYIRYLTLSCSHPSTHTCKIIQKTMENFLINIETAKIIEFELGRLELERFWKYDNVREKLVDSFVRFFQHQKNMKMFDMSVAQCPLTMGCKLLEALVASSGDTLTDLCLEDFFHSRLAVFQVKRFRCLIAGFTNLSFLSLNYNCISETIIEILTTSLSGKLRNFSLKVYRSDPHFHHIPTPVWRRFHQSCPCLEVDMWFESIGSASETVPILVPDIPLKDIHIWTGYDDDSEWNLHRTLMHIGNNFKQTLRNVSLELDNNHEILDEAIKNLISKCKKLKDLTINAFVTVEIITQICELQEENKISKYIGNPSSSDGMVNH
ncbi:hypothetical protein LOTGIDRAFT_139698 [Lottia gigantea]|uniref:F-box domain-containing protein n=1 Tax=Lottia gigantea TaxID=225164 RepID=V4ABZ2_LOTGI|nr:hypothetical protein LOTGIDRAFT_139698 [Lottia gigantea]ESP01509.1 hypothetical protein LOTGIDRAFT_139698 [Lottia gigantea]